MMIGQAWGALVLVVTAGLAGAPGEAGTGGKGKPPAGGAAGKFAARWIAAGRKGYVPRACGFDMNRNGLIGEAADRRIADGRTRDPDGDGIDEDLLYVHSQAGSDRTGDGSPARPFRTIGKALEAADGPQDGAEDIICIAGTFHETVTLRAGGAAGHYVRDGFQFPRNPTMIVGWDADGDGNYPPFDKDDEAVLDGQGKLPWAIESTTKPSFVEIAHLTIRNYGCRKDNCGAIKLFRWGTGSQSHIYIHDVEMHEINKAEKDASGKIVLNFWGGPMRHVAFINNLVNEYASYFCRGAPPDGAGRFRFRNNTLRMYGVRGGGFVTGWKLWGHHRGVEVLDNLLDCNARAWRPEGHVSGIGVCQGTQDWTIRGNVLIDLGITLQPFAKGYPFQRRLNDIRIDGNIFRSTYDGWRWPRPGIHIQGYQDAPAHQTVENATITNNFFSGPAGWGAAVLCTASNGAGPQVGTITIAGNTFVGPFDRSRGAIAIQTARRGKHRQESFIVKNNIIARAGEGLNVAVEYAPARFLADGNVYDPKAAFRWNEPKHWRSIPLAAWRAATGQDRNSRAALPAFVDLPGGDLHLTKPDTAARGRGVDITRITNHDIDNHRRSPTRPTAGADVPETER